MWSWFPFIYFLLLLSIPIVCHHYSFLWTVHKSWIMCDWLSLFHCQAFVCNYSGKYCSFARSQVMLPSLSSDSPSIGLFLSVGWQSLRCSRAAIFTFSLFWLTELRLECSLCCWLSYFIGSPYGSILISMISYSCQWNLLINAWGLSWLQSISMPPFESSFQLFCLTFVFEVIIYSFYQYSFFWGFQQL